MTRRFRRTLASPLLAALAFASALAAPPEARAQNPMDALRPAFGREVAEALAHLRTRRFQDAYDAIKELGTVHLTQDARQLAKDLSGSNARIGDAGLLVQARAALALRRWEEAARLFGAVADKQPLLADHFNARGARAWLNAGDAERAFALASAITAETPVLPEATLVAADAAYSLRKDEEALRYAKKFVEKWPKKPGAAPALWILTRASERQGDRKAARAAERRIVAEFPESSIAARIGRRPLSPKEALGRAEKLVKLHRNDRATTELRALLGRKLGREQRCKASYLLGAALQRRRKHKAAYAAFRRAARACADDVLGARVHYLWGKGLTNGRNGAGAARILEKLARRWPKHRLADDALLLAAQAWRRQGRLDRARRDLEKLLREMPDGDMRPRAGYELARIIAKGGDLEGAAAQLLKMADEDPYPADSYLRGRPLYALGRLRLARRDRKGAAEAWRRCLKEHPHTYWAALARGRLRSLGLETGEAASDAAPTPDAMTWPPMPEALARSAAFQRASALIRLGAGDFASPEVSLATKEAGGSDEARAWLSLLYYFAGDWHRAHSIVRYKMKALLARPPEGERRRFFLLGYPRGFWDVLEPTARRFKVDPLLLVALVREESAFNATIESWANAVGLGQLIWPTAKRIARVLRLRGFHRGQLVDPAINLQLAAKYLSNLMRRFKGAAPLAVAAYNAGELAVERWLRARGQKPLDSFVDAIPYEQTRLYTRRVMRSYATYRLLYGEGSERFLALGPKHGRQRRSD